MTPRAWIRNATLAASRTRRPLVLSLSLGLMLQAAPPRLALAQTAPARPVTARAAPTQAVPAVDGPLVLTQVQGRVELQGEGGVWAAQASPAPVTTPLRTGTGRARLRAGEGGEIVVGSASQLRRLRDEADLSRGRFFLRGPVAVHVQGSHLVMEGAGQLRVDLADATRRVAMLAGSARLDLNGQLVSLSAGQQVALKTGVVTPFEENDPWYTAQFRGNGEASVEATRGLVRLSESGRARNALVGDLLAPGSALNTGADAWAEIGFSGGGYLRLCADSELSVLSVERTSRGREVLLKLQRGTAWNVVEKGQGGYRIDTPVVSTAVRGTTFRVDADGLVKVFDGQVALPSQGDQPLGQGQQREVSGVTRALVPDALDRFNQALDAERARPLTLDLGGRALNLRDLALEIRSQPGAGVSVTLAGRTIPLGGVDGVYRLSQLEASLPEGTYRVRVSARRAGQTLARSQLVTIDHTPPVLSGLSVRRQGRVLTVSGRVQDANPGRVRVTVTAGAATVTHFVDGRSGIAFRWLLPNPGPGVPVGVTARDGAGNESRAEPR